MRIDLIQPRPKKLYRRLPAFNFFRQSNIPSTKERGHALLSGHARSKARFRVSLFRQLQLADRRSGGGFLDRKQIDRPWIGAIGR
jgi:hypothetical protein